MGGLPHLLADTITTAPSPPPPPPPLEATANMGSPSWDSRISPSVLLIIAILAIIFFLSGLLHLLIRYLLTPSPHPPQHLSSSSPSLDHATALQGQLQQLFHLHDSGVDQSFIDALPVFLYRSIVTNDKNSCSSSSSDPFDCAVCLCEFDPDDRLRLLPKCSHAFHLHCIDTWLLSHSTCPLCRRSLLPAPDDPLLLVDNPLTLLDDSPPSHTPFDCVSLPNSHVDNDTTPETTNISKGPPPPLPSEEKEKEKEKVVPVKLGKFRNTGGEGSSVNGEGQSTITDRRRCFSMGHVEYVLDEGGTLPKAAILPPARKPEGGAGGGGGGHRRRLAMSECDCHSRRMAAAKKESVSFSKTWLRGGGRWRRKERPSSVVGCGEEGGLRRVASFGLGSEFDSGSEVGGGFDVESCCETGFGGGGGGSAVVRRGEEAPSFARRTMLWVMGRGNPNKVGSHV